MSPSETALAVLEAHQRHRAEQAFLGALLDSRSAEALDPLFRASESDFAEEPPRIKEAEGPQPLGLSLNPTSGFRTVELPDGLGRRVAWGSGREEAPAGD